MKKLRRSSPQNRDPLTQDLIQASDYAGSQMALFVEFIMSIDYRLDRAEATLLAGQVIKNLPNLFQPNTKMMESLKAGCQLVIASRQHDHPN